MSASVLHVRSHRTAPLRNQRTRAVPPRKSQSPRTTTILLVRHAAHDLLDRVLVGRMPGVPLSAEGIDEARRLARRLARQGITRVHTSPRQRAVETARIISRTAHVPFEISFGLDEIDFGAWTGLPFEELSKDGSWVWWNMQRSLAAPPDGETMRQVQDRIVRYLNRVRAAHTGGRIALVTHAEVIRAAVMHCQGLSLDAYAEVQIAPAAVVALTIDEDGARIGQHGEAG